MGLLNFYLSKMMADADRDEQRKYQETQAVRRAQGQADYANSLLGSGQGWQTWENGSLGAPSGYPAEFGPVPTTKDWRTAPDLAAQTIGNIQRYRQAPIIAEQQLGIKESLAPREQALNASNSAAAFNALRQYNPTVGNASLEAEARKPYVTGIATSEAQAQQLAAQDAIQKAQLRQSLGMTDKETRAALVKLNSENAQNQLSETTANAALATGLIPKQVKTGQLAGIYHNVYGSGMGDAPPGKMWVINPESQQMTMESIPGYENPMDILGAPQHEQIAQSLGFQKRQPMFTTGGVVNPPAPAAPPATVKPVVAPVQPAPSVLQQILTPSVQAPVGTLLDEQTANDLLSKRLAHTDKHSDTIANYKDDYGRAARRAIAGEISLPPQYIGGSSIQRDSAKVLSELINRPDGSNIVNQINLLTPEQKNRIYRKALMSVGVK